MVLLYTKRLVRVTLLLSVVVFHFYAAYAMQESDRDGTIEEHDMGIADRVRLKRAVADGDVALVSQLIHDGVPVNENSALSDSMTVLMEAALHNSIAVIPVLLRAGARVDDVGKTKEGDCRALDVAAQKRHVEIVRMLCAAGAHVKDMRDGALLPAIRHNYVEVVGVLLAAEINLRSIRVLPSNHDKELMVTLCASFSDHSLLAEQSKKQIIRLLDMSGVDCKYDHFRGIEILKTVKKALEGTQWWRSSAKKIACKQNWNQQDLIDCDFFSVIFGDKPDAEMISEKWFVGAEIARDVKDAANTCRGGIKQLIAHYADPLECDDDQADKNPLLATTAAAIRLNREKRLLAEQQKMLIAQGVKIKGLAIDEDCVMAVAQMEVKSTSEDDCAHISKRKKNN